MFFYLSLFCFLIVFNTCIKKIVKLPILYGVASMYQSLGMFKWLGKVGYGQKSNFVDIKRID